MKQTVLSKTEVKDFVRSFLETKLNDYSFNFQKYKESEIDYVKTNIFGNTSIGIYIDLLVNSEITAWQFGVALTQRLEEVEALLALISKNTQLEVPVDKHTFTVSTSVTRLHKHKITHRFEPVLEIDDVKKQCNIVLEFLELEALPFIKKMQDIKEIDKLINQGDEIWGTDWNQIIGLGGNFNVKRLIIAYLAGGIEHMEEVNLKENIAIAKLVEEQGTGPFDPSYKQKLDNPVGYTLHYLRSLAINK